MIKRYDSAVLVSFHSLIAFALPISWYTAMRKFGKLRARNLFGRALFGVGVQMALYFLAAIASEQFGSAQFTVCLNAQHWLVDVRRCSKTIAACRTSFSGSQLLFVVHLLELACVRRVVLGSLLVAPLTEFVQVRCVAFIYADWF